MPEHIQNNIDLVHAEGRFPGFQFPDEADAHSGAVGQVALRQFEIKDDDLNGIKNDTGIEWIKTSAKNCINIKLLFETVLMKYMKIEEMKHKDDGNIKVVDNRKKKKKGNML